MPVSFHIAQKPRPLLRTPAVAPLKWGHAEVRVAQDIFKRLPAYVVAGADGVLLTRRAHAAVRSELAPESVGKREAMYESLSFGKELAKRCIVQEKEMKFE
jgi:hypothetical protein